jgi:hypothetical protein
MAEFEVGADGKLRRKNSSIYKPYSDIIAPIKTTKTTTKTTTKKNAGKTAKKNKSSGKTRKGETL